jgi:hypothetical protein
MQLTDLQTVGLWGVYMRHKVGVGRQEFCVGQPEFCVLQPEFCVGRQEFCVGQPEFCVLQPEFCVGRQEFCVGRQNKKSFNFCHPADFRVVQHQSRVVRPNFDVLCK